MASGIQRRTRWERVAALELPPTRWERAWASLRRRDVLLRIGLAGLAALILCGVVRGWHPPFGYRVGQVVPRDVVARVPFEAEDPKATENAQDLARRQVRWIYSHDPRALDHMLAALEIAVGEVVAAETFAAVNPQVWADFAPRDLPGAIPAEEASQQRFERFQRALGRAGGLAGFRKHLADAIAPFRDQGILIKQAPRPGQASDEIEVYPAGRPDQRRVVRLAEVVMGSGAALRQALDREFGAPDLVDPLFDWLWRRMPSTLLRDERETKKAMDQAAAAVGRVMHEYAAGETVVPGGEPLLAADLEVLWHEYEAAMSQRSWGQRIGRAAAMVSLIVALFALAAVHLVRREPRLTVHVGRLIGLLGLMIATVALARWASFDPWRAELLPVLLFGQVIAIAYRQELALMLTTIVAVILALALGHSLATFLLLMGVTVSALLQLGPIRSRSKLIYAGAASGVVAFGLTIGLAILDNQPIGKPVWVTAACNGLWTVAAGFVITGLLPFVEKAFGVLTDMSLLELGDISHPLLQQLVQRAPATYNHSITVGSIAEAAAEAIGARGLLARVGAYYHDVGKMLNPEYFVENQSPDDNRHDSLVPTMSTLVIIAHIKDGADLARQHGLPQPIIDFIEQHHGTTLVEFFYGRAQQQADPDAGEIEESQYRYPGPKPQTKEAAVLMLADAVESASRTLVDPAPARIESLVREVAERKLDDGQFDESGLTLRELRTIEDSMIKSLIANYHGRIKYPEATKPVRSLFRVSSP